MLSLSQSLDAHLRAAMQRAFPETDAGLDPQLAPASKPEFGDFQANGALPLAKPLKQAPRQIATAIVEELQADPALTDLCMDPQIAGPGFINLTIRPERLVAEVSARLGDERLGVPAVSNAAPVVVDFSSPNMRTWNVMTRRDPALAKRRSIPCPTASPLLKWRRGRTWNSATLG